MLIDLLNDVGYAVQCETENKTSNSTVTLAHLLGIVYSKGSVITDRDNVIV